MEGGKFRSGNRALCRRAVAFLAAWLAAVVLVGSCSSNNSQTGDDSTAVDSAPRSALVDTAFAQGCADNDNDGYGEGCAAGADCDDSDANYAASCPCLTPTPGCACDVEGMFGDCGHTEGEGENGLSCGNGVSACTNGVWQECILNNSGSSSSGLSVAASSRGVPLSSALASGTSCVANICDPGCREYVETPAGIGDPGVGVIVGDGGVTLPGGSIPDTPGDCAGGADFGTCEHHVCEVGPALTVGCAPDGTSGGTERGVVWSEDFSDNAAGWSLDNEWEIGSATASSGHQTGFPDPDTDTSPTADNGVAGVQIGGNADRIKHGWYYLTGPEIDISTVSGDVTLSLWRHLNADRYPYMRSRIQLWDETGNAWITIWQTGSSRHRDDSWHQMTFDVTQFRSDKFRVRFGFRVYYKSVRRVSSWNVDDVEIIGDVTLPASPGCAELVCAANPSCCIDTGADDWAQGCVDLVLPECGIDCQTTTEGECVACFQDGIDHDGDGSSYLDGDCLDCDPNAGPGAYDFIGNGIDEDCDGTIDNAVDQCDADLALLTQDPDGFAQAIDLCQFTTADATGPDRKWGVISSKLVRADGSTCTDAIQRSIPSQFGINNFPQKGSRMSAFSSGSARSVWEPGYQAPNGRGWGPGLVVTPPAGFPQNAAGCATGTAAIDSCGLELTLRAPTNAESFSFDFDFFSSEYPEWVCTAFNDTFIALYDGALNPHADKNISFDANGDPVSVNVGFFGIPGSPTAQHPLLAATGHDGECRDPKAPYPLQVCGGATDWLRTSAPVNRGEEIKLRFLIWDTGDRQWDSTVLLDNFKWSALPATIETKRPDGAGGDLFAPGDFIRDYDASQACLSTEIPVWSLHSWTATTAGDSRIEYFVANADTLEGLGEPGIEVPLLFTDPPGPTALAGDQVVVQNSPVDTQSGSAFVGEALDKTRIHRQFLRVRAHLLPSTDLASAPVLHSWNLEISCIPGT